MLYESREAAIKLFTNYSSIESKAKQKGNYGKGLEILTPKEILQKLPTACAQVKAASTSKNLLNEIR